MNHTKISTRIYSLVLLLVAALVVFGAYSAWSISEERTLGRADEIKTVVESAVAQVEGYAARAQGGEVSVEQAKAMALQALSLVRYRGKEYVFALDAEAVMLMHPIRPEMTGQPQFDVTDPTGKFFFRDMLSAAGRGGGYVDYLWRRTADTQPVPKKSYVATAPSWGWIIGSGIYIDDINAANFNTALLTGGGVLLAALLLGGVAAVVARTITRPIGALTRSMKVLAQGDTGLQIERTDQRNEIGEMARALEVFRKNREDVLRLDAEASSATAEARRRAAEMRRLQDGIGLAIDGALEGNFDGRVPDDFVDADLSQLAGNINGLLQTLARTLQATADVLGAISNSDLTQRVSGTDPGTFAMLRDYTNKAADQLAGVISELRSTSRSLRNATGEILAGANDLAGRTSRQAAAVEETSAALEELSSAIADNSTSVQAALGDTRQVLEGVRNSSAAMQSANSAMEEISFRASRISNIISLIDDIAFQTNLLALNASVEAARAGDAGKGFAVVAVEVRRLAQSAAGASSDVKTLVEEAVAAVSSGRAVVSDAGGKLGEVLDLVERTAERMSQIASINAEQAGVVGEVNGAVRQMDEMTQHNAALVEETNAAIEQTEAQAAGLDRLVEVFRLEGHRAAA